MVQMLGWFNAEAALASRRNSSSVCGLRTLAAENNNKTRAAARLGISTKSLHNMLQRWGLLHRQIPRGGSA